ncbi:relaxase domain-containing protein [Streptomyces sp. NPDC003480]
MALDLASLILRVGRRDRGAFGVDVLGQALRRASPRQLEVLFADPDRIVRRFAYRLAIEGQTLGPGELARAAAREEDTVVQDLCATTLTLLRALGDEETRAVIEAAHEWAIAAVLAWIEDEAAILRFGAKGVYQVRPVHGLVAARFRHYEARSGMPLLHDHLLLSVKAQRPHKDRNGEGIWGSVHSEALYEHAVAASALYDEVVMAEACEALGLASEPRTVTAGRRPVMTSLVCRRS